MAFVPMFLVAGGYYYMNRADPDCGTSFSWVTKAMGPQLGWLAGWAIVVADVIVMANLAQIAGLYTFLLFDANSLADSTFWVTFVGVIWIIIMTAIVTIGIELSARTQVGLLGAEIITLAAFAVVALVKVYAGSAPQHIGPPELQLDQPARGQHHRDLERPAARRVHLLGLGHNGNRQRGNGGLDRGPRQGDGREHGDPARDLHLVAVAAIAYAGLGELQRTTRMTS